MSHSLRDLLTPEPPHDPAGGMRQALVLHEEGVAIERLRLRRLGVPEPELEQRISEWLGANPAPCAGVPGFRRREL